MVRGTIPCPTPDCVLTGKLYMEAIGIPDQKYNTSEKTNNNGQFLVRASHKKYALFFFKTVLVYNNYANKKCFGHNVDSGTGYRFVVCVCCYSG